MSENYLIPPRLGIDDFPQHLQHIYRITQQEKETSTMAQQHITPSKTETLLSEVDQELAAQAAASLVQAVDHDEQAKLHAAEAKAAKEKLALLVGHGKHTAGNLTISVANAASKFNKPAFEEQYPSEVNPALYALTLDTSAIPPKLKNQFMIPGEGFGTITVK